MGAAPSHLLVSRRSRPELGIPKQVGVECVVCCTVLRRSKQIKSVEILCMRAMESVGKDCFFNGSMMHLIGRMGSSAMFHVAVFACWIELKFMSIHESRHRCCSLHPYPFTILSGSFVPLISVYFTILRFIVMCEFDNFRLYFVLLFGRRWRWSVSSWIYYPDCC